MLSFAFPADPLNPRRVDEYFAAQRAALDECGLTTFVMPSIAFAGEASIRGIAAASVVAYRGWMLDKDEYQNFVSSVLASGGVPHTSVQEYLSAHHLPGWYPLVREYTPETVIFPADVDLKAELVRLGWPAFFLKDYVKSLKTKAGSLITDPGEAQRVIEDMRRFRGTIEGGICVRRVEDFRANSEVRYFVLHGRAFGPDDAEIPPIVTTVASRFEHPFFSVDLATTQDGRQRVVEIGDGQVSDPVGWSLRDFARMWQGAGVRPS